MPSSPCAPTAEITFPRRRENYLRNESSAVSASPSSAATRDACRAAVSQILALPRRHVESVESNGIRIRPEILQAAERWTTGFIDCHDFTINDRFVRQSCKSRSDGREATIKPFPVTRKQRHPSFALYRQRSIPVQLQLVFPSFAFRQFLYREARHRFDEVCVAHFRSI